MVWLLAGVVTANVAAAEPGRGDRRTPRGHWFNKLDRGLQRAIDSESRQGSGRRRVIIRTRAGVDLRGSDAFDRLIEKSKGSGGFGLSLVGGVLAEVKDQDLEQLAALPDVEGISVDAPVKAHQSATDACSTWVTGYGTACGDAGSQFSVMRGAMGYRSTNWDAWDVGVAVIDSGVAASDDLRITASYDFRTGIALPVSPYDGYGHGTHIAGLIASSGTHSKGYYQGVAPGAKIISLRVLDSNGGGYTSNVIKAVEFAVANRTSLGIHIINLSLGHPIYEPAANDPLVLAVESAVRAGIVVVVSAGNFGQDPNGVVGYAGISSPGNAPSAITVGTRRSQEHRVAARRHRGAVQLARPDLVRRLRQAGHPRAGPPPRGAGPVEHEAVSAARVAARHAAVGVVVADDAPPAVGHEHVDRGGLRRNRVDARRAAADLQQEDHAERDQGHPAGDGAAAVRAPTSCRRAPAASTCSARCAWRRGSTRGRRSAGCG